MKPEIKKFIGKNAAFTLDGDVQRIESGGRTVAVLDARRHVTSPRWSAVDDVAPPAHWTGETYDVREAVAAVIHAVGRDGWHERVYCTPDVVLATDGYRLSTTPNRSGYVGTIPLAVADLLVAVRDAVLDVGHGRVRVRSRHLVAEAEAEDVTPPDWRSVVPTEPPAWTATLQPWLAGGDTGDDLSPGQWTRPHGEGRSARGITSEGTGDTVRINGKYLDDALDGQRAAVEFRGEMDQVVVRVGERLDIVMPMRRGK
jgi:hypothetical protein